MKNRTKSMQSKKGWKPWVLATVMGAVLLGAAGCSEEPKETAPGVEQEKKEPLIIADATADEEEVNLEEKPVSIDYNASAEEILSQYTVEGMSRFKLNYPDTFSMDYALKNIGKTLPDFKGMGTNSSEFDSKSLKGKPFVLNISKTTCPVCEEMSPVIKQFAKDENVKVVHLYPVDNVKAVGKFRKIANADMEATTLVADMNPWLEDFTVKTLNVAQVPTLVFVDETGRISYTYIGKTDAILLKDMKGKAFGKEKLYDFVRKEVVKTDKDGKEIPEDVIPVTPELESQPKTDAVADAKK